MLADSIAPAPRLLVFRQAGCPACADAEPALQRLRLEYASALLVISLDVNRRDWAQVFGWQPSATPAYAFVADGKIRKKHVGVMDYPELLEWLGLTGGSGD